MSQEIAVEVRHVGKTYNTYRKEFDRFREAVSPTRKSYHSTFTALKDVDLTVYKGECVGIIGTNGSGKSTLLKIITGVLRPTSGEVKLQGHVSSLLELGAGFNLNYTGMENIFLNGRIMGFTDEEMEKRVPLIQQFADIGDFIYQPVKNYSSGMFARLAFAVAINVDPDVLIVDEALSVGDIFFQTKCYHKFNEFRKAGKTILFVSHDLGSIIKYCDRCLLLNRGDQITVGPCKDVVDLYRKIMVENYQEERNLSQVNLDETMGQIQELASESEEILYPKNVVWKDSIFMNSAHQEYGDKSGEIVDFGIMNEQGEITTMLNKGETFTVLYRFRFNKPVDHPIFAFTIRDLKGTELCGTNTMYEDRTIEKAEPGLTGVITFRQRMTLQGGQYMLALGLTGFINGELIAYHRLYDVCEIQVLSDSNTVGIYDVESKISYSDIQMDRP
jgi:teichoic acid transport system ATP-binding protein